jgi:hypothetical protein
MGMGGEYIIRDAAGDPFETVPESSRRGRALPVWAVMRALGRSGLAGLMDGLCANARLFADGVATIDGAQVENDVVYTQVCATFGSDARTEEVTRRLLADGTPLTPDRVPRRRAGQHAIAVVLQLPAPVQGDRPELAQAGHVPSVQAQILEPRDGHGGQPTLGSSRGGGQTERG